MSPAMIRLAITKGFDPFNMAMRMGIAAAAVKEPRETNLHFNTTAQVEVQHTKVDSSRWSVFYPPSVQRLVLLVNK
mgnify:CR=1 FL=1